MSAPRKVALGLAVAIPAVVLGAAVQRGLGGDGDLPEPQVPLIAGDLAHGRHLVDHVLACGACHGADLGGATVEAGIFGDVWAPNLTPGGPKRSALDVVRALRRGEAPDGRRLVRMPVSRWAGLTESDLASVLAALEAAPPISRAAPAERSAGVRWLAGLASDRVEAVPPPLHVPVAPDATYGRYLATIGGCHDCHGPDLQGASDLFGRAPGILPRPEAPFAGARFADALLRGRGADGRTLDAAMPWQLHAGLTDTEVDALWSRVRHLAGGGSADERSATP